MPVIEVKMWKGRSGSQKKDLIENLTETTARTIGCPAEAVHVLINEYEKEDWGIAGVPASEIKR